MPIRSSATMASSSLSLFILSIVFALAAAQYEGDLCNVDGGQGICTRLQKCQSVYNDLLSGKRPKSVCGYDNFDPIICCPSSRPTPTPVTAPTPTTQDLRIRGTVARSKCEEYSRAVYELKIPPILVTNVKPVNVSVCAIKSRKLIVGGKKADPKEFPHMAAIGYNNPEGGILWSCGGTLISERYVLSAAHCVFATNWGLASWARLGDLNLERNDDDASPQNFRIVERMKFPQYKKPSQYHDIALFKLDNDVRFNAWIRPSCLPYSLPDVGSDNKATATGWGHVEWAADSGSSDLLKVTLSLVSQTRCNSSFTEGTLDAGLSRGIVGDWQICAGEPGKDTCQGDSGGPLVVLNNDYGCMYNVIGVTSLGRLCGSIIPGVYTRVYNYVSWIESIVWPDS